MSHFSWDYGVIDSALSEVLGITQADIGQKTSKTFCEKRVKVADIDNEEPDCKECRDRMVKYAIDFIEALQLTPEDQRDQKWRDAVGHYHAKIERYK